MQKDILNLGRASEYTGLAKSTLYKLVHNRKITFYKPNNKMVYFLRTDLDEYLTRYRFKSASEIELDATNYTVNGKRGGNHDS